MSSQDLVRKRKRKLDRQSHQGERKFLTESQQPEHSPAKRRFAKNDDKGKVRFRNRTPEFSESLKIEEDKKNYHSDIDERLDETPKGCEDVQDDRPEEGHKTVDETDESSEIQTQQDDETDEQELKAVKEELSQMSFEELQQLKEKLGTKMFNQVMHGQKKKIPPKTSERQKAEFKRTNKKRPMEISSKKTVARYRQIIPVKKKMFRDPRFDDLSGEYKEEIFQQSYSFINDVKGRERIKLQKQLKKEKDPEKKAKIKSVLNRMEQQLRTEQDKARRQEQEKDWLHKERELVSQGKKPYFLKKSDKRKLELAEKYRELQKSGKLEKYMSKKRKKTSQKQRRKMIDL